MGFAPNKRPPTCKATKTTRWSILVAVILSAAILCTIAVPADEPVDASTRRVHRNHGRAKTATQIPAKTPVPHPVKSGFSVKPAAGHSWVPHSKNAFTTLLYDDQFVFGARVLGRSLTKYPPPKPGTSDMYIKDDFKYSETRPDLVALVTAHVSKEQRELLESEGWFIKDVTAIQNPHMDSPLFQSRLDYAFTKIHIFNLTEYESVAYIDGDCLATTNLEEVFSCPNFCAAIRGGYFNTGVMVVHPKTDFFEHLVSLVHVLPSYNAGEQGFMNSVFPRDKMLYSCRVFDPERPLRLSPGHELQAECGILPPEYNGDVGLFFASSTWNITVPSGRGPKIVHYTMGPVKPWQWYSYLFMDLHWQWYEEYRNLPGVTIHLPFWRILGPLIFMAVLRLCVQTLERSPRSVLYRAGEWTVLALRRLHKPGQSLTTSPVFLMVCIIGCLSTTAAAVGLTAHLTVSLWLHEVGNHPIFGFILFAEWLTVLMVGVYQLYARYLLATHHAALRHKLVTPSAFCIPSLYPSLSTGNHALGEQPSSQSTPKLTTTGPIPLAHPSQGHMHTTGNSMPSSGGASAQGQSSSGLPHSPNTGAVSLPTNMTSSTLSHGVTSLSGLAHDGSRTQGTSIVIPLNMPTSSTGLPVSNSQAQLTSLAEEPRLYAVDLHQTSGGAILDQSGLIPGAGPSGQTQGLKSVGSTPLLSSAQNPLSPRQSSSQLANGNPSNSSNGNSNSNSNAPAIVATDANAASSNSLGNGADNSQNSTGAFNIHDYDLDNEPDQTEGKPLVHPATALQAIRHEMYALIAGWCLVSLFFVVLFYPRESFLTLFDKVFRAVSVGVLTVVWLVFTFLRMPSLYMQDAVVQAWLMGSAKSANVSGSGQHAGYSSSSPLSTSSQSQHISHSTSSSHSLNLLSHKTVTSRKARASDDFTDSLPYSNPHAASAQGSAVNSAAASITAAFGSRDRGVWMERAVLGAMLVTAVIVLL